jgi:hypothetical protein
MRAPGEERKSSDTSRASPGDGFVALGIDHGSPPIDASFSFYFASRYGVLPITVAFRYPHLIKDLMGLQCEQSKKRLFTSSKPRKILVLGAGLDYVNGQRSIPILHELAGVFPKATSITVIDIAQEIGDAIPFSSYCKSRAKLVASSTKNFAPNPNITSQLLLQLLPSIPERLPPIQFERTSFEKMKLEENSWDIILATQSIEYALRKQTKTEQAALAWNLLKALAPGGRLITTMLEGPKLMSSLDIKALPHHFDGNMNISCYGLYFNRRDWSNAWDETQKKATKAIYLSDAHSEPYMVTNDIYVFVRS